MGRGRLFIAAHATAGGPQGRTVSAGWPRPILAGLPCWMRWSSGSGAASRTSSKDVNHGLRGCRPAEQSKQRSARNAIQHQRLQRKRHRALGRPPMWLSSQRALHFRRRQAVMSGTMDIVHRLQASSRGNAGADGGLGRRNLRRRTASAPPPPQEPNIETHYSNIVVSASSPGAE